MPAPSPRGHLSNRKTAPPFRSRPKGMRDAQITHTLERLDEALPQTEASIPSVVAAILRLRPGLSDADVVRRVAGLDDPAEVARVRGQLAAGRDPSKTPPFRPHEPQSASQPARRRDTPSGGEQATEAVMPTFRVVAADGTVHRAAKYRHAMILRARFGGTLSVE